MAGIGWQCLGAGAPLTVRSSECGAGSRRLDSRGERAAQGGSELSAQSALKLLARSIPRIGRADFFGTYGLSTEQSFGAK